MFCELFLLLVMCQLLGFLPLPPPSPPLFNATKVLGKNRHLLREGGGTREALVWFETILPANCGAELPLLSSVCVWEAVEVSWRISQCFSLHHEIREVSDAVTGGF